MELKEIKEYNEKIIKDIKKDCDKYSVNQDFALLCQTVLIRCKMDMNRISEFDNRDDDSYM